MNQNKTLIIFYDGSCYLCSREMNFYQKSKHSSRIKFVNIMDSRFRPELEGLDAKKIHQVLHIKDIDGTIKTGLDAFIQIWKELKVFPLLVFFAEKQPTRFFFFLFYQIFARFIRPILPKKSCKI